MPADRVGSNPGRRDQRGHQAMNRLMKVIRANDHRITRFHSERGQLMPLGGWVRIPAAVWARISGTTRDEPWMVPAAVSYLSKIIKPSWEVFEFGSGLSTLWY